MVMKVKKKKVKKKNRDKIKWGQPFFIDEWILKYFRKKIDLDFFVE